MCGGYKESSSALRDGSCTAFITFSMIPSGRLSHFPSSSAGALAVEQQYWRAASMASIRLFGRQRPGGSQLFNGAARGEHKLGRYLRILRVLILVWA